MIQIIFVLSPLNQHKRLPSAIWLTARVSLWAVNIIRMFLVGTVHLTISYSASQELAVILDTFVFTELFSKLMIDHTHTNS